MVKELGLFFSTKKPLFEIIYILSDTKKYAMTTCIEILYCAEEYIPYHFMFYVPFKNKFILKYGLISPESSQTSHQETPIVILLSFH